MRDLSDPATVPTEVPSMAVLLVAMISELAPVSLCYIHVLRGNRRNRNMPAGLLMACSFFSPRFSEFISVAICIKITFLHTV